MTTVKAEPRTPTIGDISRMRDHAASTKGGLDTLADLFIANWQDAVSMGRSKQQVQAEFDLACVSAIRGARRGQ